MLLVEKDGENTPATICRSVRRFERRVERKGKTYSWEYYKLDCFLPKSMGETGGYFLVVPLTPEDYERLERGEAITIKVSSVTLRILKPG
jgi:hypothetical protein